MDGGSRVVGWKLQRQWQKRMWYDKERWVTISKIVFSLKVGAAMAAEIAGVCVLTSILDLIFCKCLSVQNINQRVNRFFSTTD